MIKVIIFDFYGVIHSDEYHDWLALHSFDRGGKFKRVTKLLDQGNASLDEYFTKLSQLSGIPVEQIRNEFAANSYLNEDLLALILDLKKTYKIALLSNANSSHLREMLKKTGTDKLFDCLVISSEVGVIKPSSEIYAKVLDKLDLKADEALFIDDNPSFVEVAISLGMQGVIYQNYESLVREFKTIGIIK